MPVDLSIPPEVLNNFVVTPADPLRGIPTMHGMVQYLYQAYRGGRYATDVQDCHVRAMDTLRRVLPLDVVDEFNRYGVISITGRYARYLLEFNGYVDIHPKGPKGTEEGWPPDKSCRAAGACLIPAISVPAPDITISNYIVLKNRERFFLETAILSVTNEDLFEEMFSGTGLTFTHVFEGSRRIGVGD